MQEYQIKITRQRTGKWMVTGYWEINLNMGGAYPRWDLDGAPRYFDTRKDALEFCMNQTGIPE